MTNTPFLDAATGLLDDIVAVRRDIHANPELGLDNSRTQGVILEGLSGLGFSITTGAALTSVVADIESPHDGPTVLLRADSDALPLQEDSPVDFASTTDGKMHACGHDAHVAMLLGAARLLSEHRNELPGNVRLMFQPGEEGFHGARHMIDEGVLEGVDRAFAIHVTPNLPAGFMASKAGPLMASADEFDITVLGRGGHASAPHQCTDPIPAAAEIVTNFQTMVTRTIDTFAPGVVTVANLHAGTTRNVIPETARIEGTIRSVDENSREKLHTGIERVASHIASAHDCGCKIHIERGYPVTVNNPEQFALMGQMADQALGPDHFIPMPTPVMGAEDWSYVLQKVPGAMGFLGVCPPDIENFFEAAPVHSNLMRLNEAAMPAGVAMHFAMAMAVVEGSP